MSKITLTNIVNLQNETTAVNAINNNNATLTTALDNTLSRNGTAPNTMGASLDMNSNRILNIPSPVSNYEPIRLIDVSTINGGGITVSPLPAGGTTGQVLEKNSSTNFDVSWQTAHQIPAGGTSGQLLIKNSNTDYDTSWSGTGSFSGVVINPTSGTLNQGLVITQTSPATGTNVGPLSYNLINIIHEVATTGAETQSAGLRLNMSVGGNSLAGQPIMGGYFNIQETLPGVTSGADKIGLVGSSYLNQTDTNGGFYGLNSVTTIASGGSAGRAVGFESDVDVRAGGTTAYRYAISAVTLGPGQGSTLDTAFFVGNINNSPVGGFQNLMTLSNSLGQAPLTISANMFYADAVTTIGSVFNMPNVTVSGNILNFPGIVLTGSGQLTTQDVLLYGGPATVATGQGSVGASANGGIVLTGFGAVFDFTLNNKLGQNVCAVSTGTRTLAINTVTITNALGVSSGGTGLSAGTSGGIPYFSSNTALTSSAALTLNGIVIGGGAGGSPTALGVGLNGMVMVGVTSSAPQFASISGDAAITNTGVWINSKVNGVAYPTSPSTNTVPVVTSANTITYGTVPNAALTNSSMTISGKSVSLGGSYSPARAVVASAAPTGTTAGPVMVGLGLTITPTTSGNLLLIASGVGLSNTQFRGITVQLAYGTGTAPVNGAAATGTVTGQSQSTISAATSSQSTISLHQYLTGLTTGTTYWVDLQQQINGAGTSSLQNVELIAIEL